MDIDRSPAPNARRQRCSAVRLRALGCLAREGPRTWVQVRGTSTAEVPVPQLMRDVMVPSTPAPPLACPTRNNKECTRSVRSQGYRCPHKGARRYRGTSPPRSLPPADTPQAHVASDGTGRRSELVLAVTASSHHTYVRLRPARSDFARDVRTDPGRHAPMGHRMGPSGRAVTAMVVACLRVGRSSRSEFVRLHSGHLPMRILRGRC